MSDVMYPTRLRWHHTVGVARHDGVQVELRRCPLLRGWECVTEIDYVPQVIAHVRIGCEATRDMTADEQTAALAMLHRLAYVARGALE